MLTAERGKRHISQISNTRMSMSVCMCECEGVSFGECASAKTVGVAADAAKA